ncbi:MAG: thermonuclease family protein [Desulfuromusa sp.]|nr:thermonuclease family protein [Desulfuromusa sp.]
MLKQFYILLALFLLPISASPAAQLTGQVTWIYDGDTLKVENVGKVRLIGIDTPESKASPRDRFYTQKFPISKKKLRDIASQAKQYNIRNIKGKQVRLELDQTHRDKYDRLLAYVYLPDGKMLNRILLNKGLAIVFRRYDFQYKRDFLKIEKKARKNKRGLWKP